MSGLTGVVVCVEYDDLLAITLPKAMRTLSRCYVITSPEDQATIDLCLGIDRVEIVITDAFRKDGAVFNKGRAIQECLDQWIIGEYHGWVLIFDADIVMDADFVNDEYLSGLDKDKLYGCHRRMLTNGIGNIPDNPALWNSLPLANDIEFPGFFQLFHTDAESLKGQPYWYDPTFTHAGGGDAYFQSLFGDSKYRMRIEVLHLGERDRNWYGRVTNRVDGKPLDRQVAMERQTLMTRLRRFQGWMAGFRATVKDRVSVPGVVSKYIWGKSQPPKGDS